MRVLGAAAGGCAAWAAVALAALLLVSAPPARAHDWSEFHPPHADERQAVLSVLEAMVPLWRTVEAPRPIDCALSPVGAVAERVATLRQQRPDETRALPAPEPLQDPISGGLSWSGFQAVLGDLLASDPEDGKAVAADAAAAMAHIRALYPEDSPCDF